MIKTYKLINLLKKAKKLKPWENRNPLYIVDLTKINTQKNSL